MLVFYPLMLVSIFMRRRPLARAAVVGGAAYYAGSRHAQGQEREADQEARLQELEAQQYASQQQAAPPPAAAGGQDGIEQLKQLAQLHEQGVLTDAEFEIQKTKILQSM